MGKLEALKAIRRANLAALRQEKGPANLAKLTHMTVAQLYQMAEGKGASARNVSDAHARKIERMAGLSEGWLDEDHSGPATKKKKAGPPPASVNIYFALTTSDFRSLSDEQQFQVQQLLNIIEETVKRAGKQSPALHPDYIS